MPGIYHDVTINSPLEDVFAAVTRPKILNRWWTLSCAGSPESGALYWFYFGPDFDWYAEVTIYRKDQVIEWRFTQADEDWNCTRLRFLVTNFMDATRLRLEHKSWQDRNDHFRRSSYCWAQYLRLLKVYLERGEVTLYNERTFG